MDIITKQLDIIRKLDDDTPITEIHIIVHALRQYGHSLKTMLTIEQSLIEKTHDMDVRQDEFSKSLSDIKSRQKYDWQQKY